MNEQLKQTIMAVGALSELWVLTYTNLLKQGLDPSTAAVHTKLMIEAILSLGNK